MGVFWGVLGCKCMDCTEMVLNVVFGRPLEKLNVSCAEGAFCHVRRFSDRCGPEADAHSR